MRWVAVLIALLVLGGCSGGSDSEASLQGETEPPATAHIPAAPTQPRAEHPSPVVIKGRLAIAVHGFVQYPARIESATIIGHTLRYVLKTDMPAGMLRGYMTSFLLDSRFGVAGRRMVVHLLDGDGRFAWSAGYDGRKSIWTRVRHDLSSCGPIWYANGRKLPNAPSPSQLSRCPREPLPKPKPIVLR